MPGIIGAEFQRRLERRADEDALPCHAVDVGLQVARGIGASQMAVLGTELGADSIQSLGLVRVEDKVPLGGELVVQPAQAQMSGTGSLPHGESSCAIPLEERCNRHEDLVLAPEAILRRPPRFSGHDALFLRTTPVAVAENPT
jgi:hypothetical protein